MQAVEVNDKIALVSISLVIALGTLEFGHGLPITVRLVACQRYPVRDKRGSRQKCGERRLETGVQKGTKICDCESERKVNLENPRT